MAKDDRIVEKKDAKTAVKKVSTKKVDKKKRKGFGQFFRELSAELKKVSWPTRKELVNHTIVVLVFVLAFSALIGLIDLGLMTPLFNWMIK